MSRVRLMNILQQSDGCKRVESSEFVIPHLHPRCCADEDSSQLNAWTRIILREMLKIRITSSGLFTHYPSYARPPLPPVVRLFPPFGSESKRVCDVAWGLNGFSKVSGSNGLPPDCGDRRLSLQKTRQFWSMRYVPKPWGIPRVWTEHIQVLHRRCTRPTGDLQVHNGHNLCSLATHGLVDFGGCLSLTFVATWTWLEFDPVESTNILFPHRILCIHDISWTYCALMYSGVDSFQFCCFNLQ